VGGANGLVRFIRTLLFEIQPTDIPTYAVAILIVLIIGLFAAAIPAYRATRVAPVVAMR
jgi:ABC-type antimicrobial peptide transport system permease subunit